MKVNSSNHYLPLSSSTSLSKFTTAPWSINDIIPVYIAVEKETQNEPKASADMKPVLPSPSPIAKRTRKKTTKNVEKGI